LSGSGWGIAGQAMRVAAAGERAEVQLKAGPDLLRIIPVMIDATRQNFSSRIIHAYPYPYQNEATKK
jgi:hypothetical protein